MNSRGTNVTRETAAAVGRIPVHNKCTSFGEPGPSGSEDKKTKEIS